MSLRDDNSPHVSEARASVPDRRRGKPGLRSALSAAAICLAFASVGQIVAGSDIAGTFRELQQPWFALPIAGWVVVGVVYYGLMGVVLYRVLVRAPESRFTLYSVLALMAGNELWNVLLFRMQDLRAATAGMVVFAIGAAALGRHLYRRRNGTFATFVPYLAWVVVYDLPWSIALWVLNPVSGG